MTDYIPLREDVSRAIEQAITKHEGGFVTKWMALVESADADGVRGVWLLCSDDASPWDNLGLMAYGSQLEQARTLTNMGDG